MPTVDDVLKYGDAELIPAVVHPGFKVWPPKLRSVLYPNIWAYADSVRGMGDAAALRKLRNDYYTFDATIRLAAAAPSPPPPPRRRRCTVQ